MQGNQILARLLKSKKKIGGSQAFFRDNEATIIRNNSKKKETYGVFFQIEALRKMHGYSKFSFWIPRALAKFCFLRIVLNRAKISLY